MLANFKQTLLRRVVQKTGILCFDLTVEARPGDAHKDVDAESVGAFLEHLQRTRIGKTAEYYSKPGTFFELAVYMTIVEVYGSSLLYPMLGDPARTATGNAGKLRQVDLLMDRDESAIGSRMQKLLDCLRTWDVGGPSRRPWLILEAIGAPIGGRLSSSVFRRYEVKYSSWPFRLRAFYDSPGSIAAAAVAQELIDSPGSIAATALVCGTCSRRSTSCSHRSAGRRFASTSARMPTQPTWWSVSIRMSYTTSASGLLARTLPTSAGKSCCGKLL